MDNTTEKPGQTNAVEFELDGVTCTRWIDSDGLLHVSGPEGMEKRLADYGLELARLCSKRGPVVSQDPIKPFDVESVPIQYRAILYVLEDQADKAAKGEIEGPTIPITVEQIKAKIKQMRLMRRIG